MDGVEVWKDVLYPGRQRLADGSEIVFTAGDIAAARRNCERMLARGLRVPAVWGHQPGADPVHLSRGDRLANYAKHMFGEITGAQVRGGVLWLRHKVYRPADAEHLARTRMQVSPKVYPSYSDSRGGRYRGATVGHVAATPTPVQYWQMPFNLSRKRPIYFSYSPEGKPVADEKDDDKGEKGGEGKGGQNAQLAAVCDALREKGFNVPDEVKDWDGLVIAIKAGGPYEGDDDPYGLGEELGGGAGGDTTAAGGPPALMSDERAEPLRRMARRDLEHRARQLFKTGRVDRPTAERLIRDARTVELSFTAAGGQAPCKLADRIEAYEQLPVNLAWSKTGGRAAELSDTRPLGPPDQLAGRDDGGIEAVLKQQEELAKRYSSTPKK